MHVPYKGHLVHVSVHVGSTAAVNTSQEVGARYVNLTCNYAQAVNMFIQVNIKHASPIETTPGFLTRFTTGFRNLQLTNQIVAFFISII